MSETAVIPEQVIDEQRDRVYRLLKEFTTAMLVTHTAEDPGLRARPMAVSSIDDDGKVWFVTSSEATKVYEIQEDTRVHLVFQHNNSAHLFLSGTGRTIINRSKIADFWNETMRVWFPGGKDDPSIVLIEVTPTWAEYWDNQGVQKIKYLFDAVKAYASGIPPTLDEKQHGQVNM